MWDQLEISNRNHSQAHKLCRLATSEQIVGCTIKECPDIAWRCAFGDLMLSCRWFCPGFQFAVAINRVQKIESAIYKAESNKAFISLANKHETRSAHHACLQVEFWDLSRQDEELNTCISFSERPVAQQNELDSEMKSALRFCDRYKGLVMGSTVGALICCIEGRRRRNVTFDKHPFVWFGLHVYKNLAESMPHNHLSWFLFFVWWGPARLPSTVRLLASPSATVIHDHDTYIMIHTSWYGMIRHDTSWYV